MTNDEHFNWMFRGIAPGSVTETQATELELKRETEMVSLGRDPDGETEGEVENG